MEPLKDLQNFATEEKKSFLVPPTPQTKKMGFGTGVGVYAMCRGSNSQNLSPWALKKVERKFKKNENLSERLKVETEVLKSLSHPNIIGFRGEGKTKDGRICLAMESCGKSLGDLIEYRKEEEMGPFPVENILTVAECLCAALEYLHNEKKLLHGDIKSFNVLIKGDFEHVKLCDFGTPVILDQDGRAADEDQEYIGTDLWSAPEVLSDGIITDKADIFSFGLTLWEMLALEPPNLPSLESSQLSDSSVAECTASGSLLGEILEKSVALGQPPKIPEGLPSEYDFIGELINICTLDCVDRPNATQLINLIRQHRNKQH